uniref:Uncharacterized protein n=1 Tax=viral metagenome TaxID=1070528 RepID=A0A6C0HCD2_9ZZZZ
MGILKFVHTKKLTELFNSEQYNIDKLYISLEKVINVTSETAYEAYSLVEKYYDTNNDNDNYIILDTDENKISTLKDPTRIYDINGVITKLYDKGYLRKLWFGKTPFGMLGGKQNKSKKNKSNKNKSKKNKSRRNRK